METEVEEGTMPRLMVPLAIGIRQRNILFQKRPISIPDVELIPTPLRRRTHPNIIQPLLHNLAVLLLVNLPDACTDGWLKW
jgi:hypothetical protein